MHVLQQYARLLRRYLHWMSLAVSGPRTVFDHKQLYQRFVHGSATLQPGYLNPTCLRPTASKPWSCGSYGRQNLIFQGLRNRATHLNCRGSCFLINNSSTAPSYVTDMLQKKPSHSRKTRSSSYIMPLLN